MQRAPFEVVDTYLRGLEPQSGDAMLTKAFWNVLGIGPTDPGRENSLVTNFTLGLPCTLLLHLVLPQ